MSIASKLRVVTREIATPKEFDITRHLPENATAFIRGGQGIVGFGQAAHFEASGPNRIRELAALWREQVSAASIEDPLQIPGSGLVGFGSMAFSDHSAFRSQLIVPKIILGTRDGKTWLTKVAVAGEGEPTADFYKSALSYRRNPALEFNEGALDAGSFQQAAEKAIELIRAGNLQKVVLARDIEAKLTNEFDLRRVLRTLAQRYPSCWVYSVAGNFGASPELLVRVSHSQVSARVLAGTAARGTTAETDQEQAKKLVASVKNLAEHRFAVESMAVALSPFCTRVDTDETPFALALPNLWHLASDVYGRLKENISALDLAAFLHPTAAVAGTPRERAQQLIAELEPFDRGGYSGPVGWIGADGDGEWAIALRGGNVDRDLLTAYAGCGLVADSEPISELAETELKFAPVRHALR